MSREIRKRDFLNNKTVVMKWITIKLMKLQLKIVSKQQTKIDNSIVSQAYEHMIKTYKNAIMYLEVHNKQ